MLCPGDVDDKKMGNSGRGRGGGSIQIPEWVGRSLRPSFHRVRPPSIELIEPLTSLGSPPPAQHPDRTLVASNFVSPPSSSPSRSLPRRSTQLHEIFILLSVERRALKLQLDEFVSFLVQRCFIPVKVKVIGSSFAFYDGVNRHPSRCPRRTAGSRGDCRDGMG